MNWTNLKTIGEWKDNTCIEPFKNLISHYLLMFGLRHLCISTTGSQFFSNKILCVDKKGKIPLKFEIVHPISFLYFLNILNKFWSACLLAFLVVLSIFGSKGTTSVRDLYMHYKNKTKLVRTKTNNKAKKNKVKDAILTK